MAKRTTEKRPDAEEKKMRKGAKPHEVRKNEILDRAQQIFFQKGYDETTVQEVIDTVGIAKGTFYHYFPSKEELLEGVILRYAKRLVQEVNERTKNLSGNAIEKINAFCQLSSEIKLRELNPQVAMALLQAYCDQKNILLRYKLTEKTVELLKPIFEEFIKEGAKEGALSPVSVEGLAEFLMRVQAILGEELYRILLRIQKGQGGARLLKEFYLFYEGVLERLLGAPPGSLKLFSEESLERFAEELRKEKNVNESH